MVLRLVRANHAVDLHVRAGHAFEPFDCHGKHLRPTTAEQSCRVAQLDLDADPIALDIDRTHATGTHRILVQVRVGVLTQYGFDSFACDGHDYSQRNLVKQTGILPRDSA